MNNRIKVVAFIGKAGSGKTIAAKHLIMDGYIWLRFADTLKAMLRFGLGLSHEQVDGSSKNEPCEQLCGKTTRLAMITLGTEWGRDMIHPDIWVNALEREFKKYILEGEYKFVIDDVRFINEAEWVKNLKYNKEFVVKSYLIRLVREKEEKDYVKEHRSETEQDGIGVDYTIINVDTLETLHDNIDMIVRK